MNILRFLRFWAAGQGDGHVQSLVIGGSLLVLGVLVAIMGMLADLIGANRKLLEANLVRLRALEDRIDALQARPEPAVRSKVRPAKLSDAA